MTDNNQDALPHDHETYMRAIRLAYKAGYLQGKADEGRTTLLPGGLLETVTTELPPGCHCSKVCMAPRVMGRQMPCRRTPPLMPQEALP